MARKARSNDAGVVRSGDLLIEQYRAAMMTLVAVLSAEATAKQTEQQALDNLASLPSNNGLFVTPGDIPQDAEHELTRRSLDAHLQKVQSAQIRLQGTRFTQAIQADTLKLYKGRRVQVSILEPKEQPVEVYWRDADGSTYLHGFATRSFTGIIEDIQLDEDMLVLKPGALGQLFSSRLAYYVVYVINPDTVQPMVKLSLT